MPTAEYTTTINRAPADVFAFVANGLNATKWRPGVLDIALVSGSGVGTIYRQGVKGPMGRRIAADYEITTYEPARRLAFKAIAGPVRPSGDFRLEPVGSGTRLTFSLAAELSGLKRLFMGRMVQQTMTAEANAIENLKRVMET